MDSSVDGEEVEASAEVLLRRWLDVGRWMERNHRELFLRQLAANEVTVTALSSVPDENNG
jgi:hypothetical protein